MHITVIMLNIVTNSLLYIWKLLNELLEHQSSHHTQNLWICELMKVLTNIIMEIVSQYRYSLYTALCFTDVTVQFSSSVVSNSLRPHESQHARPPCPSPTLRVHPNPCPVSRWCQPTISSLVIIPFSSCPQSFPASGSFPMNQLFTDVCFS